MHRLLLIVLLLTACQQEPDDGFATRGGITGIICAPGGQQGLAGVEVYSVDGPGTISTETDQDGRFDFPNPTPGTYSMVAAKGIFTLEFAIEYSGSPLNTGDHCFPEPDVHVAVIAGVFDSIGALIQRVGLPLTYISDEVAFLQDTARMAEYDAIFFNCGMDEDVMALSGTDQQQIGSNLRDFVSAGGGVYASDWASFMVELIDDTKIDFLGAEEMSYMSPRWGVAEPVEATVLDADLARIFDERRPEIEYELAGWVVIEDVSPDADPLLRADVRRYLDADGTSAATMADKPLAVRWEHGDGKVVYTTFHNEDQVTEDMETILFEFILSL